MNRQPSPAIEMALEVMDGIDEAGLVVVPTEPHAEMIAAAIAVADVDEDVVRTIYRVMVENS